jgi:hypothetical protein
MIVRRLPEPAPLRELLEILLSTQPVSASATVKLLCRMRQSTRQIRAALDYGRAVRNDGKTLASTDKISMLQPETASLAHGHPCPDWPQARNPGKLL